MAAAQTFSECDRLCTPTEVFQTSTRTGTTETEVVLERCECVSFSVVLRDGACTRIGHLPCMQRVGRCLSPRPKSSRRKEIAKLLTVDARRLFAEDGEVSLLKARL